MRPVRIAMILAAFVLLVLWRPSIPRGGSPAPAAGEAAGEAAAGGSRDAAPSAPGAPGTAATGPLVDARRSPLADGLHAPEGSVADDLAILQELFGHYRTVFRVNPTGSNREITSALSGGNPRLFAPFPRDHEAINGDGELTDRWGNPYFFHNLSAQYLEVRSAGPDGILWNADDAVLSNAPDRPRAMKLLVLLSAFALPLDAAFLSESSSGDISDDYLAPDVLTLDPGSNFVSGQVVGGDPDLFTIVVPAGLELVELRVAAYNFFLFGNRTFIGYQDGPTLSQAPADFAADSAGEISYLLIGQAEVGREVLGNFTASPNASAGPLGAGSYAFWMNEIEPQPAAYALEFVTAAAIPEPGSMALIALAMAGLGARRKRR